MKIRFMGLITHVLDNGHTFAVLITAPMHQSRLIVPIADIVGEDPGILTNRCWNLTGLKLSFSSAGLVDRSGLMGVSDLNLIGAANSTLHPNVPVETPGGLFDSFVDLAGGFYGIEDYFIEKATFNGHDYLCIPRTVTFTTTDTTHDVTVFGLASPLTLRPTAVVTITNLDIRGLAAPPHFYLYGGLFNPLATIAPPVGSAVLTCADGAPPFIPLCPKQDDQNMSVECSNSQYP